MFLMEGRINRWWDAASFSPGTKKIPTCQKLQHRPGLNIQKPDLFYFPLRSMLMELCCLEKLH